MLHRILKSLFIILMLQCPVIEGVAQPGSLDKSFLVNQGQGFNGDVYKMVKQNDGKLIAVGEFTSCNGVQRKYIARLNTDGTTDLSFDPGVGIGPGRIRTVAIQTDGKIIVGGNFNNYNGIYSANVARLNVDGSLDTAFSTGANGWVYAVASLPDGKFIVAGSFTQYLGVPRAGITRCNTDGTVDSTFNPGSGFIGYVISLSVQPDGKIIAAGDFYAYDGYTRWNITRINSNGSADVTFLPNNGTDDPILATTLQPDGKVFIGGMFLFFNSVLRGSIARLNIDGTLDVSFNSNPGFDGDVKTMAVQPDGKILAGGNFYTYKNIPRQGLARLHADGSLDTAHVTNAPMVYAVIVEPDNTAIIGGTFSSCTGRIRTRLSRINTDGRVDLTYNPWAGPDSNVYATALQPDGRVIIGGAFTLCHGKPRNRLARLFNDGSPDYSFDAGSGPNAPVKIIVLQPDGKMIITGTFSTYQGMARSGLARVNPDGSLDPTFNAGMGANGMILAALLQPDNRLLIGGVFTAFNGSPRNRIARLNTDGSLDLTFNPGTGLDYDVFTMALQQDGHILIGGDFSSFNGITRNGIVRIYGDGSLDPTFNPGSGANYAIHVIGLQQDGRIIITGEFTLYNGKARPRIARLLSNGLLDLSFNPGLGTNAVRSIQFQPDGKMITGGDFIYPLNRVARYETDGSSDSTFNLNPVGAGAEADVRNVLLQPDGKIIICGFFETYNQTARHNIARLHSDLSASTGTSPTVQKMVLFPNPASEFVNIHPGKIQGDFNLTITDLTGRVILNRKTSIDAGNLPYRLELTDMSSGYYILSLRNQEEQYVQKLIKK